MFSLIKSLRQLTLVPSIFVFCCVVQGQAQGQTAPSKPASPGSIFFTVVDQEHHSVNTLKTEDVRVFEGDQAREIISFQRLEEQPLSLAILIDASPSQERTLPNQKLAADAFVQGIMRQGKNQVGIISFTGRATIEQDLTKDPALVQQGIARVKFVPPSGSILGIDPTILGQPKGSAIIAGSTALWDAIWATCEEMLGPADSRKAIILLSDGDDTSSKTKMREAIERAVTSDIAVYSVGIGDRNNFGVNESALRAVSEKTGGRAFFPKKVKDLEPVFAEIQEHLRLQYQITYRSEAVKRGSPQKVRLEIVNPALRDKNLFISYQRLSVPNGK